MALFDYNKTEEQYNHIRICICYAMLLFMTKEKNIYQCLQNWNSLGVVSYCVPYTNLGNYLMDKNEDITLLYLTCEIYGFEWFVRQYEYCRSPKLTSLFSTYTLHCLKYTI